MYTAFSRVTSLENLYINETFKPPASANFRKDKVLLEMERMRNECPYKVSLRFPTRSDRNEQYNILYHNIRCVNKKIKYIESDVTYANCDVLILVETRTTKDSEISLKKVIPIYRIDGCLSSTHACGTLVYVRSTVIDNVIVFQHKY